MKKLSFSPLIGLLTLCLFLGCISTGPVQTQLSDSVDKVVKTPNQFESPEELIKRGITFLDSSTKVSRDKVLIAKAILELYQQQKLLRDHLANKGELILDPGNSYQFKLQSFCVHAGKNQPFKGDGLYSGPLKGSPSKWLPEILNSYSRRGIDQHDAQLLIWSLLSDLKYDELPQEQKENLKAIFPDAGFRFGNRFIEDNAKSLITGFLPTEVTEDIDQLRTFRDKIRNAQNSFADIEEFFAPPADHQTPIPVGWLKSPEGYLMHLSSDGYQEVDVKLYVPPEVNSRPVFRPSKIIAIPSKGQRLALSPVSNDSEKSYLDPAMKRLLKIVSGQNIKDSELKLIKEYPLDALRTFLDAQEAVSKTQNIFKVFDSLHNNEADAFRHFYWSSKLSSQLGVDQADKFLTAHEDDESQPISEKNMDLFNNHEGEKFVRDFQNKNNAIPTGHDIELKGIALLKRGELKVIDPTGRIPEIEE